jgi:hypothetical protein
MKQWITLLAAPALLVACTKQNLQEETIPEQKADRTSVMRSAVDGAFVSDWEQYSAWTKSNETNATIFSMTRKTPEITSGVTNGGLVLGYAKLNTNNSLYYHLSKPTMLPFYYLPQAEKPYPETYYFSETSNDGNVVIRYRMPFTKADAATLPGGANLQDIQFQHVVLTAQFLQSRGLNPQTVQNNFTYEQVMALVNP